MALSDQIEQQTRTIGREIFARLKTESPSVFHLAWWDEKILDWCMRDETVKVQMFRFIDVLPMLKAAPGLRPVAVFEELCRRHPSVLTGC